jgi:hypothetical protein
MGTAAKRLSFTIVLAYETGMRHLPGLSRIVVLTPKPLSHLPFPCIRKKKAVDKMKVLHKFKTGDHNYSTKPITRSIAIRQFCVECMGWQTHLVSECTHKKCVLYPYRMGPGNDLKVEEDPETSLNLSPEGK